MQSRQDGRQAGRTPSSVARQQSRPSETQGLQVAWPFQLSGFRVSKEIAMIWGGADYPQGSYRPTAQRSLGGVAGR